VPPDVVPLTLVKLSQMAADCPEIHELDINPLLADDKGVLALDARVSIRKPARLFAGQTRFAVRPYPSEWEGQLLLRNGSSIAVRPMRPEDEPAVVGFLGHIRAEDLRLRFFHAVKEFSHQFVGRLTLRRLPCRFYRAPASSRSTSSQACRWASPPPAAPSVTPRTSSAIPTSG
jgi:acetyltransferase